LFKEEAIIMPQAIHAAAAAAAAGVNAEKHGSASSA